jgi:hypothetical protein
MAGQNSSRIVDHNYENHNLRDGFRGPHEIDNFADNTFGGCGGG